METLYTQALHYHIYSVIGFVIMITVFYLFTQLAKEIELYKKRIRSWMPIYIISLAATIFTGILMMAAKHLRFDLTNNLMIGITFFIIFLELKRAKMLKRISQEELIKLGFIRLFYALELMSIFTVVYLVKANHI